MKGIVFKKFLGLMEEEFGEEICETVIFESNAQTKGAYSSVGTYDHNELIELVSRLSTKVNMPVPVLVRTFGKYLIPAFYKLYPSFFEGNTLFEFLMSIDGTIHTEVLKLNPDAELPSIKCHYLNEDTLIVQYISKRPFGDLAEGLLLGAIDHFKENVELTQDENSKSNSNNKVFYIERLK